jgi:ubiquinone/menaquinone biosynthesis C-methylase UbiE
MATWPYRKNIEIPTLLNLVGDTIGKHILDFGCGTGMFSRWLKSTGAERIVGYDVSKGMINYARKREEKEKNGITFVTNLTDSMIGQFDLVLAVYVLPYISCKEELLSTCRDMAKLLRPKGRLLTLPIHPDFHSDPDYYRPYGLRLVSDQVRQDGGLVNLHLCYPPYDVNITAYYWSKNTLEDTLQQAGFISVHWPKHQLDKNATSPSEQAFLHHYLQHPHAAIIDCRRG